MNMEPTKTERVPTIEDTNKKQHRNTQVQRREENTGGWEMTRKEERQYYDMPNYSP